MRNSSLLVFAGICFLGAICLICVLIDLQTPKGGGVYLPTLSTPTQTQVEVTPIILNSNIQAQIIMDTPTVQILDTVSVFVEPSLEVPTTEPYPTQTPEVVTENYDPSLYDPWHPYVEPTLGNVINLDAPTLDDEIDRVYYGLVGTRTPMP